MSNRNNRDKQATRSYARFLERFLAVVGALTLLVLAVLGIAALYAIYAEGSADQSAKKYASESGLAILSVHSEQDLQSVLLQRLSSEVQKETTQGAISEMVESLNKLGKLKDYKGVETIRIQTGLLSLSEGIGAKFTYTANAAFENGTGLVKMTLVRHGDGWQINGFYITATTNPR